MPYSNSEWEAQLDRTLRNRYSASLMNDTKWREVWAIVCALELQVQMNYADNPSYGGAKVLHGPFKPDYIEDRGIRDPGIGGPFLYKQILWLRVPKSSPNDNSSFREQVDALGNVPITENDEYFEVRGYEYDAGEPGNAALS